MEPTGSTQFSYFSLFIKSDPCLLKGRYRDISIDYDVCSLVMNILNSVLDQRQEVVMTTSTSPSLQLGLKVQFLSKGTLGRIPLNQRVGCNSPNFLTIPPLYVISSIFLCLLREKFRTTKIIILVSECCQQKIILIQRFRKNTKLIRILCFRAQSAQCKCYTWPNLFS